MSKNYFHCVQNLDCIAAISFSTNLICTAYILFLRLINETVAHEIFVINTRKYCVRIGLLQRVLTESTKRSICLDPDGKQPAPLTGGSVCVRHYSEC